MNLHPLAPGLIDGDAEPLMGLAALARMAFAGADLGPLKARLLDVFDRMRTTPTR